MASPMNPYGEDQVYNLGTTGAVPEWLKQNGDLSSQMIYLTRDVAKFTQVLHTRFPKPQIVPNRKYEFAEVKELERFYTVSVDSTTGATTYHTKFGLSNQEALQIQVQDILYLGGIYSYCTYQNMVSGQVVSAASGVQGTNVGPDIGYPVGSNPTAVKFSKSRGIVDGYYFADYEAVLVTRVYDTDSAGAGNTYIEVERCYHAPHAMDRGGVVVPRALVYSANGIGGDAVNTVIDVGMRIFRGTPAYQEGTNAPDGLYKNPRKDNNFMQQWKYAVSYTLESQIENKVLSTTPMSIHKWMITRRSSRDKEFAYLMNRKGMYETTNGSVWYAVGGVIEFIPKDADHYIPYTSPSLSWPGFLDLGKKIFVLGGSAIRYMWSGYTLECELRKMFYADGHMRFEPGLSKDFNIEVNSLNVCGGKIILISNQILEECGYSKMGICLDMDYSNTFVPVTNAGWDFKYESNIAEKGSNLVKELIQGMFGLKRHYRDYHCLLDFNSSI